MGVAIFYGCTSLKSVSLPDKDSLRDDDIFWECPNANKLHIERRPFSIWGEKVENDERDER